MNLGTPRNWFPDIPYFSFIGVPFFAFVNSIQSFIAFHALSLAFAYQKILKNTLKFLPYPNPDPELLNTTTNMSGGLSDSAVIVIVIASASATVLLAFAAHSAFTRGRANSYAGVFTRNDDQDRYMRELRDNQRAIVNGYRL